MKGGGPKCFSFEHLFFCQGCTPVFNPVSRPIDCIQMYPGSPLSLSSFSMSTMVSIASWLDSWNMMSSVFLAFHFVLFYFVLNRPKVIYTMHDSQQLALKSFHSSHSESPPGSFPRLLANSCPNSPSVGGFPLPSPLRQRSPSLRKHS